MKTLTLFLFLSYSQIFFAQNVGTCLHAKVETVEECEKAEICIEKLCTYVLEQPLMSGDKEVHEASKKILDWMNITMNYGFTINDHMMQFFTENKLMLFGIYMVSMAKGAFVDQKHQDYEGLKILAAYIKDPKNGISQTRTIKKFIRAVEKKKVSQYIDRGSIPKK